MLFAALVTLPAIPAAGWLAALAVCVVGAVWCGVELRKRRP